MPAALVVNVHTLDGTSTAFELEHDCVARRVKILMQSCIGTPATGIELLRGTEVLQDSDLVCCLASADTGGDLSPRAGHASIVDLTLIKTRESLLPAFLRRVGLQSFKDVALDGSTALHLAAAKGEEEVCLELLECPEFVAINAQDFLWNTPLHIAVASRLSGVCEAILRHSGFTAAAAANQHGRTALHVAALRGDSRACAAILKHPSVDVQTMLQAEDVLGDLPSEMASNAGHDKLALALEPFLWQLEASNALFDDVFW